jgi:hypothetical protein
MIKPPRITEIMKVKPFIVTVRWTTGEIREINFLPFFEQWKKEGNTLFSPALARGNFEQVQLHDGGTLCWPMVLRKGFQGKEYPVALDPDVLYQASTLVEDKIVVIDTTREFTQKQYAERKQVSESVVRNWVSRGKVKTHAIPHLGITLVVD